MTSLILYTTLGCHLCEQAQLMLVHCQESGLLTWQAIDIADDEALVERYGTLIPVIQRTDDAAELGWPFDLETLVEFAR
jgi:hypothetical protein